MAVFAPRYARAFAEVAAAKHLDIGAAQQQMRDFAGTLAGSLELREMLLNPSIAEAQKLQILDAMAGRIGMSREVRNFVAVIMDHQRLPEFSAIVAEYDLVVDEDSGMAEAEITSARPLHDEDRAQLEEQVAKLAGGQVRTTYKEDAALLGGAVVRIGSTIYDGSVRAQLDQLKERLINA